MPNGPAFKPGDVIVIKTLPQTHRLYKEYKIIGFEGTFYYLIEDKWGFQDAEAIRDVDRMFEKKPEEQQKAG